MDMNKPQWKHDCNECVFLGTFSFKDVIYDLYFCEQGGRFPTVIARYGEDGNYSSGLGFSSPELKEAERRATARGLLKDKVRAEDMTVEELMRAFGVA